MFDEIKCEVPEEKDRLFQQHHAQGNTLTESCSSKCGSSLVQAVSRQNKEILTGVLAQHLTRQTSDASSQSKRPI